MTVIGGRYVSSADAQPTIIVGTTQGAAMPDLDKNDVPHYADPSVYDQRVEDDPFPETCSMCGASTHTERERTDDGEWSEDCEFVPFYDGDGNDLRRPGQAGRAR